MALRSITSKFAVLTFMALVMLAGHTAHADQSSRPCGPGILSNILIPQGFVGADFRPACRQHDACYASGCTRRQCDDAFKANLFRACAGSKRPMACRMKAMQWYWQVRLLGGRPYRVSQRGR